MTISASLVLSNRYVAVKSTSGSIRALKAKAPINCWRRTSADGELSVSIGLVILGLGRRVKRDKMPVPVAVGWEREEMKFCGDARMAKRDRMIIVGCRAGFSHWTIERGYKGKGTDGCTSRIIKRKR